MAVFFNGRLLITPVTASAINDDAMQNQNLTVGNNLALIGKSTGGQPKTPLAFGSPDEAKRVLRGGELLDAVLKAFDPSASTGAPSTVYAVRVNPAAQASLDLLNSTSDTVIELTSRNWGATDNQTKVKIENGSTSGKRVVVQQGLDIYTADNLGRNALSLLYSGSEVTATVTISEASLILHAPAATPVATLLFSEFATVGQLVDKINSLGDFVAEVLDYSENLDTANGLDFVSAQSILTEYNATANLQAIIDWFNNSGQPLVSASRPAAEGTLPENIPFTFLSGGSEGTTITGDWSDAFVAIQSTEIQWVCPISGDAAIRAMADTHVAFASTVLRRERRAITGMDPASDDAAALAAAKELNSDRTSLVHIGYYDYNTAGKLVLMPPYMTAAMIAAMFAGVNPGTPLTNKTIKVRGLERKLRNPTDTDPLILGGVLCVEDTEQGYKVVKSISTWLGNDKYNRVEQSTGAALDFTIRNVRNAVDILRGEKGNPLLLSRARSITDSTLRELAREEPQGPGVLAGDAENPAYRNISASLEGDVVRIQFECSPVIPANYILVTVFAVPYSGIVTA